MNRRLSVAVCCALLNPVGIKAQATATWRDLTRAIDTAVAAGDTAGYWSALNALQRQVGATPRLAGRLAAVAFARHDTADGLRWSRSRAAMGVPIDTNLVLQNLGSRSSAILAELARSHRRATRDVGTSQFVAQLADPDMIAEDVCYDAERRRFFVSSVRRGAIYVVDAGGRIAKFTAPDDAGVWGILALGIDRRRGVLWATTAAFPGTARYTPADSGQSALLGYDLVTGALRQRLVPTDSGSHALGDLTIGADGTVYVSDGFGGAVYAVDVNSNALRPVAAKGTFSSPQTPALAADGRRLFVPDYAFGIAVIDLASGHWHWLEHSDSLALTGIDGLYRVGDDLVAVQNGLAPNRIIRLRLGKRDRIEQATALLRGGHGVDLNHAVPVGRQLFLITQSGWDRVADNGNMKPGGPSDAPMLRRIALR